MSKKQPSSDRDSRGYRVRPGAGATLRADVVDVWVVRNAPGKRRAGRGGLTLLQLRRAKEPLKGTWQPVMGHTERGETAVDAAVREAREEVGLDVRGKEALDFFALEQVHPFYIAAIDCVVLSPRFVVVVVEGWEPRLNREHAASRWVSASGESVRKHFLWPGQWAAAQEIAGVLRARATLDALRLPAARRRTPNKR